MIITLEIIIVLLALAGVGLAAVTHIDPPALVISRYTCQRKNPRPGGNAWHRNQPAP